MDPEVEREFTHIQKQLDKYENDSRTVIILDAGFKELSKDVNGLGKKLNGLMVMIGTFGLGVIGDLVLRILKLN